MSLNNEIFAAHMLNVKELSSVLAKEASWTIVATSQSLIVLVEDYGWKSLAACKRWCKISHIIMGYFVYVQTVDPTVTRPQATFPSSHMICVWDYPTSNTEMDTQPFWSSQGTQAVGSVCGGPPGPLLVTMVNTSGATNTDQNKQSSISNNKSPCAATNANTLLSIVFLSLSIIYGN